MEPTVSEWLELVFKWIHVVAGIAWIGHLYFFNWVNSQVAKTYDADSKKKVVPELMPRALYFFRWGAAYTWITGVLMFGIIYSMRTNLLLADETKLGGPAGASAIVLAVWVVGFFVYDQLWKALEKKEQAGVIVSFVITAAIAFGLGRILVGRAMFIAIGGLFGTIMAANVWMRIWPAQRKIISATKAGTAPDAATAARATLRSKHNTYMSVPLVFAMMSNHFPSVLGNDFNWLILMVLVAVGWVVTKLIYKKSATAAPAQFEPAAADKKAA